MLNLWTSVQKDSNIQFKYQMSKVQEQEFRKDATTSEPFKKGNLMGKLIDETFAKQLLSDMDRIIETLKEIQGSGKEEKKEQRKLWKQILDEAMPLIDNNLYVTCSKNAAKISIDAMIECYEQWRKDDGAMMGNKPFPEYLKEKLGNE